MILLLGLLGLLACTRAPTPPHPGIIAVSENEEISFDEVQSLFARTPACMTARMAEGSGDREQLLPCFQELAENLALEQLVLSEIADLDDACDRIDEEHPEFREFAYLQAWTTIQRRSLTVSDDEIQEFFTTHRQDFKSPKQAQLWNIYRRHEDPAHPEVTMAVLEELKSRSMAGESFEALAREYSQSETRLRDGLVGPLNHKDLPGRLREISASLAEGEISDPIPVAGGGVLLRVTGVVTEADFELSEVRDLVRQRVLATKLDKILKARVDRFQPVRRALEMDPSEFVETIGNFETGDEPQANLLDCLGTPMTVERWRPRIGLNHKQRVINLDAEGRRELLQRFQAIVRKRTLVYELIRSVDSANREIQKLGARTFEKIARRYLVDEKLREGVDILLNHREKELRQYFNDHRPEYQSELRLKLEIWDLPFSADPPGQLRVMEKLRKDLVAGVISLGQARSRLGGTIQVHSDRSLDELSFIPNKSKAYILQAPPGGFSVPFQQDNALHLIHILSRQEPGELSYEQARERVHDDYYGRFGRQLTTEVLEKPLRGAGYHFFPGEFDRQIAAVSSPSRNDRGIKE